LEFEDDSYINVAMNTNMIEFVGLLYNSTNTRLDIEYWGGNFTFRFDLIDMTSLKIGNVSKYILNSYKQTYEPSDYYAIRCIPEDVLDSIQVKISNGDVCNKDGIIIRQT
jgi:hypothetical protein